MQAIIESVLDVFKFPEEDIARVRAWFYDRGSSYMISGLLHAILLISLVLIPMALSQTDEAPTFEVVDTTVTEEVKELEAFKVGEAQLEPEPIDLDNVETPSQ